MTRKDYVLIAGVLQHWAANDSEECSARAYEVLITAFADALQGTNEQFNSDTFYKACGIDKDATASEWSFNT